MIRIGVIGGTGALSLAPVGPRDGRVQDTPYGEPSSPLLEWGDANARVCFIARHGPDSDTPPHRVNYRANAWALHAEGVDYVLGINAVGGIASWATPAQLVCPAQLIDYSWGREHTFADGETRPLEHVEFTEPFSEGVRRRLLAAANACGLDCHPGGTYGVTQGPRLETAAEIDRLEQDGCDIVGMTAMPEAGLIRELGLDYAICALVVNRAAGRAPDGQRIHDEIHATIDAGMGHVARLLEALLRLS